MLWSCVNFLFGYRMLRLEEFFYLESTRYYTLSGTTCPLRIQILWWSQSKLIEITCAQSSPHNEEQWLFSHTNTSSWVTCLFPKTVMGQCWWKVTLLFACLIYFIGWPFVKVILIVWSMFGLIYYSIHTINIMMHNHVQKTISSDLERSIGLS